MFFPHLVGVLVTGLHLSVSQLSADLCNCFTTLLIIRSLLSPNSRSQLLNFPWFERVEHGLVHVPVCTGVFTRARCAAVKTRDGEKKKKKAVGGVTTMAWGLSLFVHKNGVCVGPGPPSLILYQLTQTPLPHAHTHTNAAGGGNWLAADTFLSLSVSLFFSLSAPFAVTRFIAFLRQSIS